MLVVLQQVNIVQKIKQAPDGDYQLGVLIGSFIPFVILVALAYWMYSRAKKETKTFNYFVSLQSNTQWNEQY